MEQSTEFVLPLDSSLLSLLFQDCEVELLAERLEEIYIDITRKFRTEEFRKRLLCAINDGAYLGFQALIFL